MKYLEVLKTKHKKWFLKNKMIYIENLPLGIVFALDIKDDIYGCDKDKLPDKNIKFFLASILLCYIIFINKLILVNKR